MTDQNPDPAPTETLEVELKHPGLAALLAWLWPGAGHLYQGRTAKGVLYMVCILPTFFYGLFLGDGRVVYASWRPEDRRLPYLCQVGVGLPALPALVQAQLKKQGKPLLFGGYMAPPNIHDWRPNTTPDDLSQWHGKTKINFELGTLFTMVAGLLNILAIYDAFAGPVFPKPDEKKQRGPPEEEEEKNDQSDK